MCAVKHPLTEIPLSHFLRVLIKLKAGTFKTSDFRKDEGLKYVIGVELQILED